MFQIKYLQNSSVMHPGNLLKILASSQDFNIHFSILQLISISFQGLLMKIKIFIKMQFAIWD